MQATTPAAFAGRLGPAAVLVAAAAIFAAPAAPPAPVSAPSPSIERSSNLMDFMNIELKRLDAIAANDPALRAALDLVLRPDASHTPEMRHAAKMTLFRALYGTGRKSLP